MDLIFHTDSFFIINGPSGLKFLAINISSLDTKTLYGSISIANSRYILAPLSTLPEVLLTSRKFSIIGILN